VRTLVDSGWNVHLGREMAVCLIVIPGGRVVVYLSPCVNPRERELARESQTSEYQNNCGKRREKYHGKRREKYHMVYGIVLYGIGIVPYGIWYRTIRYWTLGCKNCMCEKEACLLQLYLCLIYSKNKKNI
jgi:hypothetical protein